MTTLSAFSGWLPRSARRLALLACLLCNAAVLQAAAPDTQTRDFRISVDGTSCGKLRMNVTQQADGRSVVDTDASLELKYVIYTFRYTSKGRETWFAGRLEKLENAARYGKTRYEVSATAQGKKLVVKAGGREHTVDGDIWPTSYWRQPSPSQAGTTVALLDGDKGRNLQAKLELVGEEPLRVAGRQQTCAHYRLRGDVEVDVWYDAEQRMVRQASIESGHRTLIELTAISQ